MNFRGGVQQVAAGADASRVIDRLVEAQQPRISLQQAKDRGMFGPVWHGSFDQDSISAGGFKVVIGDTGSVGMSHGYMNTGYGFTGTPPPVHHLGYGVYLTTSKTIAKQFQGSSGRGQKTYYIDAPRLETINFGSPNTMMKWWIKNGFDPELAKKDRVAATKALTKSLASRFDAVWFKGKGLRRLLDGDQVVVFDPKRIYEIDSSLSGDMEIGSKVVRKSDGTVGVILDRYSGANLRKNWSSHSPDQPHPWLKPDTKDTFQVKWRKGGREYNVQDVDIEPYTRGRKR